MNVKNSYFNKKNISINYKDLNDFFKKVVGGASCIELPFIGYKTNGGIQDGNTVYWIDRVFQSGKRYICSGDARNANLMGYL